MKKVINSKKAVMIGCGFVGSASVFALMQSGLFTELVLIDADKNRPQRSEDHSDAKITKNIYNHIAEMTHAENEMSKMNLPETVPAVV